MRVYRDERPRGTAVWSPPKPCALPPVHMRRPLSSRCPAHSQPPPPPLRLFRLPLASPPASGSSCGDLPAQQTFRPVSRPAATSASHAAPRLSTTRHVQAWTAAARRPKDVHARLSPAFHRLLSPSPPHATARRRRNLSSLDLGLLSQPPLISASSDPIRSVLRHLRSRTWSRTPLSPRCPP